MRLRAGAVAPPRVRLVNTITRRAWAAGFTDAMLAERTGISRAQVNRIRNGRAVPSVTAALALSAVLGCRVAELFAVKRRVE